MAFLRSTRTLCQPKLSVKYCGCMGYKDAFYVQLYHWQQRQLGAIPDTLLVMEHDPPVITVGGRDPAAHVLLSHDAITAKGVELYSVRRGGNVTFHSPGQLVGYPIVTLPAFRKSVSQWLGDARALESACSVFGLDSSEEHSQWVRDLVGAVRGRFESTTSALVPWFVNILVDILSAALTKPFTMRNACYRDSTGTSHRPSFSSIASLSPPYPAAPSLPWLRGAVTGRDDSPGVWVSGTRKIGAVGIHLKKWTTMHGFALNLTNDLRLFKSCVNPCGDAAVHLTSLVEEQRLQLERCYPSGSTTEEDSVCRSDHVPLSSWLERPLTEAFIFDSLLPSVAVATGHSVVYQELSADEQQIAIAASTVLDSAQLFSVPTNCTTGTPAAGLGDYPVAENCTGAVLTTGLMERIGLGGIFRCRAELQIVFIDCRDPTSTHLRVAQTDPCDPWLRHLCVRDWIGDIANKSESTSDVDPAVVENMGFDAAALHYRTIVNAMIRNGLLPPPSQVRGVVCFCEIGAHSGVLREVLQTGGYSQNVINGGAIGDVLRDGIPSVISSCSQLQQAPA